MTPTIKNPVIAIDRESKQIAYFDGQECIRPYTPFGNKLQETLINEALVWFSERTTVTPTLVYPRITSFAITGGF